MVFNTSFISFQITPFLPQIHRFQAHSTLITNTVHPIHTIITLTVRHMHLSTFFSIIQRTCSFRSLEGCCVTINSC